MSVGEARLRERIKALTDDAERRISLARLVDRWQEASDYNYFVTGHILSENSQALAEQLFSKYEPRLFFWGGYPEAERKLACFLPDYLDESELPSLAAEELRALRCYYPKNTELSHRDFLGSLMGLGISRASVADILIDRENGQTDLILTADIFPLVELEYRQVSRYSIEVERIELDQIHIAESESELITGSVASLRLDAVLALAFRLSRTTALELISAGRVFLNGRSVIKADSILTTGAKVSCQGRGRFELINLRGQSRKGRTLIDIKKYK